jgi:hypothetical protein
MLIEVWVAIAWTTAGPVVGAFANLDDCRQAVALAQLYKVAVTDVSECRLFSSNAGP